MLTCFVARSPAGLPLTNSHIVRAAKLLFHVPHAGVLHGFAGYFEAVLYGNVGISIHPERMPMISKDMLSWFPLFFPLQVRPLLRFPFHTPFCCAGPNSYLAPRIRSTCLRTAS